MIVIADDDKVFTELLAVLLEKAGYEVREAYNGQSAYSLLREPGCKGIVLDIRMPGINGAELLMMMAADGIDVPVIVVSGFPDFDEEEFKQFPNVRRLFIKPVYPEEVLEAVKKYAGPPDEK